MYFKVVHKKLRFKEHGAANEVLSGLRAKNMDEINYFLISFHIFKYFCEEMYLMISNYLNVGCSQNSIRGKKIIFQRFCK